MKTLHLDQNQCDQLLEALRSQVKFEGKFKVGDAVDVFDGDGIIVEVDPVKRLYRVEIPEFAVIVDYTELEIQLKKL